MIPFKFFQKKRLQRTFVHRRLLGVPMGSIRWVDDPVVLIHYIDGGDDGEGEVNLEVKSSAVAMLNRRISSYDDFIRINDRKTILIYNFVDYESGMVYTEENFDQMPRDIELMFRGRVLNDDLSDI